MQLIVYKPAIAGDSAFARYRGLGFLFDWFPGACAPGFMLEPASRVETYACLRAEILDFNNVRTVETF
jgi:hypothetical protein